MHDVLELLHRLLAALPDIESWIDDLQARHRIESVQQASSRIRGSPGSFRLTC
jgi:hypothetical protein